jgi:hypothetical protein
MKVVHYIIAGQQVQDLMYVAFYNVCVKPRNWLMLCLVQASCPVSFWCPEMGPSSTDWAQLSMLLPDDGGTV